MADESTPREFENRLDRAQVDKASRALLQHLRASNQRKDLIGGDVVFIYLQVHLKKIPARPSNKPVQMCGRGEGRSAPPHSFETA